MEELKFEIAGIAKMQGIAGHPNDWCEENIVHDVRAIVKSIPNHLLDKLQDEKGIDWGVDMLRGKVEHIQCLTINLGEDLGEGPHWEPQWAEQDLTIIQIHHKPWWDPMEDKKWKMTPELWAEYLILIMVGFDCTGCCDAIEYIRVGQFGTLIKINSGRTFHS